MARGEIVIPDEKADADGLIEAIERYLAEQYGGFSRYDGNGGWVTDDGELLRESHVRLMFADNDADRVADDLTELANRVKSELDEEAVMTEYQDTEVRFA